MILGKRSLSLLYDTPEVYSLSRDQLEALEIKKSADETRRWVNLSLGHWQVVDRSLHFRHVPDAFAVEDSATIGLPEPRLGGLLGEGSELVFTTPRGSRPGQLSEPVWIGGEHYMAALQLDRLAPPVRLGLLGLVAALCLAVAGRAGRLPVAGALLAVGLQGLVAVRLLIAYRGSAMPPLEQEPLQLAAVAWALVPWAVVIAALPPIGGPRSRRPRGAGLRAWLPALAGWAFSLAWCVHTGGGGWRVSVWVACHLAVLAIPCARSAELGARLLWLTVRWRERWRPAGAWVWTLAPLAFLLARGALFFAGFRESVPVAGRRFALSLIHVPSAVLLEAGYLVWLWRRRAESERPLWRDLAPAAAILVGVWLGPAGLVSDLGLALLHVPVFLFALTWVSLAGVRLGRRAARSRDPVWRRLALRVAEQGPRLAPVLALALVLGFVTLPLLTQAALAVLPKSARLGLESERNYLRLLEFAAPTELRRVARRESEELAIMSSVMRKYTASPVGGRGYFNSEISPHIRSTALREHAPAVFVACEWGVLGTAGLLLLYAVLAASGSPAAPWFGAHPWRNRRSSGYGGAVACLAALTLAVPSVYMVLANYQLTLFTGKNAYLLGIDSAADMLEAAALAVLVALGSAVTRDGEER